MDEVMEIISTQKVIDAVKVANADSIKRLDKRLAEALNEKQNIDDKKEIFEYDDANDRLKKKNMYGY